MSKGFTIIELVISLFILSVAVVGIFSAFSMMIILTTNASDRLTAAYLAQEGIEVVRNIRDTNWLASSFEPGIDWLSGLYDVCSDAGGCQADYKTMGAVTSPVTPYVGEKLKIDTDGFYSYSAGQNTKFKRQILIAPIADAYGVSDHIIKATVNVFWDEKPNILNPNGDPGSITAEEYFYNWY